MLIGAVVMILAIIFSILWHEMGHWSAARSLNIATPIFSIGLGTKRFLPLFRCWKTDFQITPYLLGGFVKYSAEDLESQPVWKRALVCLAGPAMNCILALLLVFCILAVIGQRQDVHWQPTVVSVSSATTAGGAGLQPRDVIAAVGSQPVQTTEELAQRLYASRGKATSVTVQRRGATVCLPLTPDQNGDIGARIDGQPHTLTLRVPPVLALRLSLKLTATSVASIFRLVGQLLHLTPSDSQAAPVRLIGPMGIVTFGAEAYKTGLSTFLLWVAMWNLTLFIFNLLPIPALDGGALVFLMLEGLRGKPIDREVRRKAMKVCFRGLLALSALAALADVARWFHLLS